MDKDDTAFRMLQKTYALQQRAQEIYDEQDRRAQQAELPEAILNVPYTDSDEFIEEIQKIAQMEQALQEMRKIQESERQARIEAEQQAKKQTIENRIWQIAATTIGLLTLVATILFGILALLH